MTETQSAAQPKIIMLATDLTPACDRAFDRAVQLARQWGAHLTVVHVVETGEREVIGVEHRSHIASRELEALSGALQEKGNIQFSRQLGFGSAKERLVAFAQEFECDVIVTGLAYAKTYGEKLMGSTVEHLVREARAPVLAVRRRADRPYRSIAVGIDFSEPSRHALDRGLSLFAGCRFTAVHAHDIGFTGVASTGSAIAEYEARSKAEIDALIATARHAFQERAGAAPPDVRTHFTHGPTDEIMKSFIEREATDLVVIGTHGRTGLRRALIGSVAARLLNTLPCDVLAIHPEA